MTCPECRDSTCATYTSQKHSGLRGKWLFPNSKRSFLVTAVAVLCTVCLYGQAPARITGPAVNSERAQLLHSLRPEVAIATDDGPLAGQHVLKSITIFFNRTPGQEADLQQLLSDQLDRSSSRYHSWLTPEEFGAQFGANPSDIGVIQAWLTSLGFTNIRVAKGLSFLLADGDVAAASRAFGVSIHHYSLPDGEQHFANSQPITIPSAFSSLVKGVTGLDDFNVRPLRPHHDMLSTPEYNNSSLLEPHLLAAEDIRTIYDVTDLNSQKVSGAGTTIVIVGEYSLSSNDSSISTYRSLNGLPPLNLTVTSPDNTSQTEEADPGVEEEAYMDIEIAGGVAQGANIVYDFSSDFETAATDAIDRNLGQILSISYVAHCEVPLATPVFEGSLEQANAEGITVLVSSGDTGAAACDPKTATSASGGLAVNYPSSSVYVTSIGGTTFDENESAGNYSGPYWGSTQDLIGGSAVHYIPEDAWNDIGQSYVLFAQNIGQVSGGGLSQLFPAPAWQAGLFTMRSLPDLAFAASSGHDGYLLCWPGTCVNGFLPLSGLPFIDGGTSAATPLFAGIMALVDQELSPLSPRQGNINPRLYQMAQSSLYELVFHDVTNGNNEVPVTGGGTIGYQAGPGYDLVTGWGSVNAYAFASAMTGVPVITSWFVTPTSTSLGHAITVSYTTADSSGAGLSRAELWRAPDSGGSPGTWSQVGSALGLSGSGPLQVTLTDSPAAIGKYWYGTHLFDGAGNEATEPQSIQVTVNAATQAPTVTVQASPTQAVQGAAVVLVASVQSSLGTPTGSVIFYDSNNAISPAIALNGAGTASYSTNSLVTGSHSITARYGGDQSFPAATSSPVTVTVGAVAPQIGVSPQSGTIGVTVFTKSGTGFTPNGAITHTATWPDNSKSVLNGYADSNGSFSYTVTYSGETGTYYQTDTDNTTGKASNTISWTVAPVAVNDFSLSPSPGSETISQGGSATFSLVTTTISGSSQSISLSYSNAPSGMNVSFSQSVIASGGAVTFTVSAGSSVAAGTYLLTITGTGTSATHSSSVSVTVVQQPSSSAGSLASSPASFNFNPQTVDTASAPVVFSLVNSGGTAVTISSLTASPGFVPSFLNGLGIPLTLQPNGGYANMQVVFIPGSAGTQTGTIKLFNSTNASPLTISLSGSGVGAPVTTGNIQINATFNGSPWSGNLYTNLTGPDSYFDGQTPLTLTGLVPGGYTELYSAGGPGGATLQSITPSASQTLTAGSTVTFTYNFTGTNTFSVGDPQPITTVMGTGKSAQIQLPQLCLVTGAAQTIQFAMQGLPLGASVSWSANPLSLTGCGQNETATITTSTTTPPGVYSIQITGTNQSGSTSATSAWVSMNLPPASPDLLVSVASNGAQGNGDSGGNLFSGSTFEYAPISVSTDGHVIAFTSSATNLVSQNVGGLLVRDTNAGTTILGSAAADGTPASGESPSLSADGKIFVFASSSSNLPNPAISGLTQGIYVRDLSAGTVTRIDMASDGTPGNGVSYNPSLSADGRFVAFTSTASNLIPGVNGGVFVLDRKTGQYKLASVSSDGSIQTSGDLAQISASGRYVLFVSSASNLVPNDTNGKTNAFVHDFVTGETTRVNVDSDGTQDTCGVITTISSPLAISADGRYVAFESCGDLAPGYGDQGGGGDVYVHDMVTGTTSPLGIDQVGDLLDTQTVGGFSADGRFIAVNGSIIDQTTGEMTRTDVLSDGSGSPAVTNTFNYGGDTTTAYLSSDGGHTVFASNAPNLVSNDTNGHYDVFEGVNSFLTSPRLASISLSSNQAPGGTSVSGTLTLNAPAPIGGASVSVWTDNTAAQTPATVVVPSGASSAPFSITTSVVPVESVVAVLASYNSGSSVAVLSIEPAAVLVTSPSSWSFGSVAVGTKSLAESFVLSNSGTASLAISSIQMVTGQAFTVSANTCGSSIAPGASCSVSVTFTPSSTGAASDSVQIIYGSPATTQSIGVTGQGATPVAVLSPLPLSFGNQLMPGSALGTATLTNSGTANLSNISTAISGTNAADFTISVDGCSGVLLPANSSCSVLIAFSPKAKGSRSATLSITDSASGSPQTVSLMGVGVQSTPAILWTPSTVSLTSGMSLGGVLDASAQGNGSTLAGTFAYTATISGGMPQTVSQATVLAPGAYTITATFTPTDSVDYTTATTSISIAVTNATPVVTVTPANGGTFDSSQSESVTITVTGSGPAPTGTVTLSGGGYTSASTALSSGSASIAIPANQFTTTGSITLTVNYSGDTFYANGSGTGSITVKAPYSLATTTPSAINPGSNATATITLTADSSYSGTITLTCSLATSPTGAEDLPGCTVTSGSPITITNGTASGSTTVTITTTAATANLDRRGLPGGTGAGGGMILALLVFFGIPARRRNWRNLLGLLLVIAALGAVSACGGGGGGGAGGGGGGGGSGSGNPGTTAGNYTFTITGTGNPGINPAPTATVKLTVN